MPRKDLAARAAYVAAYGATHREQNRAAQRKWRAAHRDQKLAELRAWQASHREEIMLYQRANPKVGLAGECVHLSELPPELQPIALAIREARQLIRQRRQDGNRG